MQGFKQRAEHRTSNIEHRMRNSFAFSFYPPSQKTTGMAVDEYQKNELNATADVTPRLRWITTA